ncbi:MAG: ABC transporter permease [Muribaculaceae bacterium]|nr:ABC transporter permease [Muribaculaceae bacterium]
MIRKLLRRNISIWQIAGYAVATLVGLSIVMAAVQLHGDIKRGISNNDNETDGINLISKRNIVISKPVTMGATLTGNKPGFSDADISDIKSQSWCGGVEAFRAADFGVWAGIDLGGRAMQTALFFESVPDRLLDIDSDIWDFDPSSPSIPIVLPKDYLTLYNFGFASTGRMPMVSESMLGKIPLTVTLSGNGQRLSLPARIVGFSSWLNTVAVPERFMDWAHTRFGSGGHEAPSRLIVEVADPADPDVDRYLEEHDYEKAGPDDGLGRASYFLTWLTGIISAVGVIITILALGILVLSLYLLIQKNRPAISGLMLIGYSPRQVARCYIHMVMCINLAVLLGAVVCVLAVRNIWADGLARIDIAVSSPWAAILAGTGIMAAVSIVNAIIICRLVRRCFR